ncbi:MAG TPA: TonB-dependent receptor [Vicinamibacteria bacterium]
MGRIRIVLAVLFSLVAAATVEAQVTGSISGVVKDSQGGVLPGATVRVSGPLLPGGREETTTENGVYIFDQLLPGMYTVEATLTGLGTAKRGAQVQVDRDTQVELVLSPTLAEEITVTAAAPTVDMRSTEVSFNYSDEVINDLPLERSYRGLFQLIPGVAENRSPVGPSGGGSRQDNTYLMDGVNITNPGFGTLSTEINQLDIAEFNIKRGAITAEFGRSAGFVTNAVSKSGTNDFAGTARFEWMPEQFVGDFEDQAFRDPLLKTVVNPALGAGGPIIHDKVFWYGSARYFQETRWDRQNKLGTALPDEERSGHELYGKITATPTQKHLLAVGFRDRPSETTGSIGLSSADYDPSVTTVDDNSSRLATASWSFFATDRSTLEVRYLYLQENNESDPDVDLGYLPQPFNASNPATMGYYRDDARANVRFGGAEYAARVNYKRHEARAVFSQYFDLGKTGHQFKVGGGYEFGEEDFFRLTNGWGDIQPITVSGQRVLRARYYFQQPPQLGQGRTWSVFAQDTATLGSRLTLNLGVLLNRDEFAQDLEGSGGCPSTYTPAGAGVFESLNDRCTFVRFGFFDQVQPRLGVNFNLRPGAGDKVYANYGRYYNTDQKSSGRSLAPRRIFQREARFDMTGRLISDVPRASTTGKLIAADLSPTYNDEWLAGYATPLGTEWSVDLFFIYRDTNDFIEDVPSALPATGPSVAANLPCNTYAACRGIEAERKYKAFTVELQRRLVDRWSVNASYTWSRLEGNFDLDYSPTSSVFNTSSFIQDGPGTNIQEPGRDGPLRQDRPHLFKLFVNVQPVDALTLGGYLRVQSGTPWNARGQDSQGGAALYYLEPAGARRNPTWTNFDLLAAYRFPLGGGANLALEARLLNVFDTQTRLSTDSIQFLDTRTLSAAPFLQPGIVPNPFFGTADSYAPPRRFVVSALINF